MIILDIETTGLDPKRHGMVSLGAIDYNTGEEFYGECRVGEDKEIDPYSLVVNGFTIEECRDLSKWPSFILCKEFLSWATKSNRTLLLAGQQVGSLDIPFIKTIVTDRNIEWPFGYRSVDLHSVAFTKLGKSLSLDGILEALSLSPEPKPHNALTGARLERDAFKILLS